jgi:hypothetical protein
VTDLARSEGIPVGLALRGQGLSMLEMEFEGAFIRSPVEWQFV